jgi:hypothetical protein
MRRLLTLLATVMVLVGLMAAPAVADPQGFIEDELETGFFYGTFDQSPNVALFAGGTIEEVCHDDPATAPLRVFLRNDGTVDLKVNDKDQPIYLYHTEFNDIPDWLGVICPLIASGVAPPDPFATGEADLKVRITDFGYGNLEIFNSVNGKATGTDGTEYKVRGTADIIVKGGVPLGDPRDFIDFKLTEIRR